MRYRLTPSQRSRRPAAAAAVLALALTLAACSSTDGDRQAAAVTSELGSPVTLTAEEPLLPLLSETSESTEPSADPSADPSAEPSADPSADRSADAEVEAALETSETDETDPESQVNATAPDPRTANVQVQVFNWSSRPVEIVAKDQVNLGREQALSGFSTGDELDLWGVASSDNDIDLFIGWCVDPNDGVGGSNCTKRRSYAWLGFNYSWIWSNLTISTTENLNGESMTLQVGQSHTVGNFRGEDPLKVTIDREENTSVRGRTIQRYTVTVLDARD